MSAGRRLLCALGALLLCGVAVAGAPELLQDCAARAAPEVRGIGELEAACPGVADALLETGLVAGLPQRWRETLAPEALRDLGLLADRYTDAPVRAVPDAGAMRAILDQLASEQVAPEPSWWSMLLDRLKSWLARQASGSSGWLERTLEQLARSADLITALTYVLVALVIAAAAWIIVNEVRVAGALSRRREAGASRAVPASSSMAQPDISDLDALALRDQPAMLLRLLVARLMARGLLRAERNLTHRELVSHNTIAVPQQRTCFARVTQFAERQVYGHGEPDESQLGPVVADGRELLRQLQQPEAAPQ